MAQLIKLKDYVSRYEYDFSRYPSQFVRMKKRQWKNLQETFTDQLYVNEHVQPKEKKEKELLDRIKGFIPFIKTAGEENSTEYQSSHSLSIFDRAHTKEELKQLYLDYIVQFQMKWASSTIVEKSSVDPKYYDDQNLRHLLQRLPDSFLILYEPVLILNAPVELEVIILSPQKLFCLAFLETVDGAVYTGSHERFWLQTTREGKEKKVLSPLLSANRTEKIVKRIFQLKGVELPIQKVIVGDQGYIDFYHAPSNLTLLDRRNYKQWLEEMRALSSPLKMMQSRGAKALLDFCKTTSYSRLNRSQMSR